ncbi:MAG: BatD family protein [Reyranella sp.]|uniref:hypothetical protein n=1 Tax=Reyranella sp. TaxID=1929291 RepID=UPI001ACFB892|nr:hypothetical protein [Reyranella sp.]MBN9085284.1 BatD family protein [Reyranella sp.]
MRAVLALLALLLAAPVFAQQPVVVRTSVKPENGFIGQRVAVYVDVLFAGEMTRPPRVVLPEIAGAQILRFESQATTMSDRIDGASYTGQRFEFALYARRGGRLEVPAPQVSLLDRDGTVTGTATGPTASVEIAVPPGVDATQPLIATAHATLSEQWSPAPKGPFKAGDALVRIVTREADDVPAMAMPALVFAAPQGVRVYVDPPQSEDRQDRGAVTGRRIDRATYVFEAGGRFTLAGLAQLWWDLGARRLETPTLPAVTVEVAAPPAPPDPWLFLLPMLALLVLLAVERRIEPGVRRWYDARRDRWLVSEPKAYRDLADACRTGDLPAVYSAFTVWRRRASRAVEGGALAEALEEALFAGAPWTPARSRALLRGVAGLRQTHHRLTTALPPLNPLSTGGLP